MGTRGSVGFIHKGKVIATYNHFDSYPDGLGMNVVEQVKLICQEDELDRLRKNVEKLKLVDSNKDTPTEKDIERYTQLGLYNGSVGKGKTTDWYCLLRGAQGAGCIDLIREGFLGHLIDDSAFLKDSLFCEYGYLINLDDRTLDFYVGFQKTAQPGNIFGEESSDGYYPCRLLKKFEFSDIEHKPVGDIVKEMQKLKHE